MHSPLNGWWRVSNRIKGNTIRKTRLWILPSTAIQSIEHAWTVQQRQKKSFWHTFRDTQSIDRDKVVKIFITLRARYKHFFLRKNKNRFYWNNNKRKTAHSRYNTPNPPITFVLRLLLAFSSRLSQTTLFFSRSLVGCKTLLRFFVRLWNSHHIALRTRRRYLNDYWCWLETSSIDL